MTTRILLATLVATAISSSAAVARDLGDPAAPLNLEKWFNGDPISLTDGKDKNVFVIEFWSTICPYSRACVPYLTKFQEKYKDKGVILIGVGHESADEIEAYVKEQGDAIGYRIAVDNKGRTDIAYRGANRINSMPYAFVVDKEGKLVWHGHPMSNLDKVVDAVLDGTYDIEQGRRWAQARGLVGEYFRMVKSLTRASKADTIGEKVVEYGQGDMLLLNQFAWTIATEPGLMKRDLDLALKAIESANQTADGKNATVLDTYARVLFVSDKKADAVKYENMALEHAESAEERAEYEKTLAEYVKAAEE